MGLCTKLETVPTMYDASTAHITIVFAQYMLLAIQQRQNENQMERLHHNDLQKQYVFKIFYLNGLILIKVTAFRKMLHCTFFRRYYGNHKRQIFK